MKIKQIVFLPTLQLEELIMTSNDDRVVEAAEQELERREFDTIPEDTFSLPPLQSYGS